MFSNISSMSTFAIGARSTQCQKPYFINLNCCLGQQTPVGVQVSICFYSTHQLNVTQSKEFCILEFYFTNMVFEKLAFQLLGKGSANHCQQLTCLNKTNNECQKFTHLISTFSKVLVGLIVEFGDQDTKTICFTLSSLSCLINLFKIYMYCTLI